MCANHYRENHCSTRNSRNCLPVKAPGSVTSCWRARRIDTVRWTTCFTLTIGANRLTTARVHIARKFRECHEARRLLMDHYSSHTNVDFSAASDNGPSQKPWYKPSDPRDHGFPHTTLRVLTLKQNLALRGFVMATLALGAFCDKVVFA